MNSLSTFLYFLSPISSLYLISLHTCSVQETICDAKLDLGGGGIGCPELELLLEDYGSDQVWGPAHGKVAINCTQNSARK